VKFSTLWKRLFDDSRIARWLVFRIVLISSLITLVMTGWQLYLDYREDLSRIESSLDQIGVTQLDSIAHSVWILDEQQLAVHLDGLLKLADIEYLGIWVDGEPLEEVGESASRRAIQRHFELRYPHRERLQDIGELRVVAGLDAVYGRLLDRALLILASNAVKTFLVAIAALALFERAVTRHLRRIADHADAVDLARVPPPLQLHRRPRRQPDELDRLVAAIDAMGRRLGGSFQALRDSEERFRNLIEGSIQGVLIHRDLQPLFINEALARALGYDSPTEVMALGSVLNWFAPHERQRLGEYAAARMRGESPPNFYEFDVLCRDGSRCTLINIVRRVQWEGEPALQATMVDITDRKRVEAALRDEKERARITLRSIADGVIATDVAGNVEFMNPAAESLTGWTLAEAGGLPLEVVFRMQVADSDDQRQTRLVRNLARGEGPAGDIGHYSVLGRTRRLYTVQLVVAPIRDPGGERQGAVIVFGDVTEQRRLEQQLSYQASHDALTGLLNRLAFEREVAKVLEEGVAENGKHALCYVDLDQFKVVNDSCGHAAGDELLRQLANLLKAQLRKGDTLARLGGDEFGVLLLDCTPHDAHRLAEALREAITGFRFPWQSHTFSVGASIGVVPLPETIASYGEALSRADSACYIAKESGRNRVRVYRQDDEALARRHGEMRWLAQLDSALSDNRLWLAFQPIVPIQGNVGGVRGLHYELLLRMRDEQGNTVNPGAFLPAAERYHYSARLDRWVISRALNWLSHHPEHLAGLSLCSINLSGHSLADETLDRFLLEVFAHYEVPPEKICFEITETAAVANLGNAQRLIRVLRGRGCRFALDDFGSGLSSFAYLKQFPVDFLKIDGMFVKDIASNPIDLAMVRAINEIGHVMGKQTIAEFVEDAEVLARLRELGVDYGQGYHLGGPQPLELLASASLVRSLTAR